MGREFKNYELRNYGNYGNYYGDTLLNPFFMRVPRRLAFGFALGAWSRVAAGLRGRERPFE
jgi:hypothetical protein